MQEKQIEQDISSIRQLMERSSKFISLSGLSGVLSGTYALTGAMAASQILYRDYDIFQYRDYYTTQSGEILQVLMVFLTVLAVSIVSGMWLSFRKAKKQGQPFFGPTARALMLNLTIPLFAGGLFILILMSHRFFGMAAPACLIFYGLALVACSQYTYGDVRWLGIFEIVIGLYAGLLPGYGLLCWAFGFGIMNILYGIIMYYKYER